MVDANIVVSAITKRDGVVARTWLEAAPSFRLTGPDFIHAELDRHRPRIARIAGQTEANISELEALLLRRVEIVSDRFVPDMYLFRASELLVRVDQKDAPYLALALFFDCPLWTGDVKLARGLLRKDVRITMDTATMRALNDHA